MDYDLIVVGQGISGLTCAGEAARLGLTVANFEGEFAGGLVVNVNELEHFEEAEGLSGMDHALRLATDNARRGVANRQVPVMAIRPIDGGFAVVSEEGTHIARAVVLATGARIKKLGVPGDAEYEGRGVSYCADCDGPMFAGSEVVVAGGGQWAIQDALLLARDCSAVHVVHDGVQPDAPTESLERARAEPKIQMHPRCRIDAILGEENGMTGVRIRDGEGATSELSCAGLFVVAGLEPNASLAPQAAVRDEMGYLVVNKESETAIPGLWAIGQVRAGFGGWLADAAADARMVARAVNARFS